MAAVPASLSRAGCSVGVDLSRHVRKGGASPVLRDLLLIPLVRFGTLVGTPNKSALLTLWSAAMDACVHHGKILLGRGARLRDEGGGWLRCGVSLSDLARLAVHGAVRRPDALIAEG